MCPSVLNSGSQSMEEISFFGTPGKPLLAHQEVVSYVMYENPIKKLYSLTASIINMVDDANLS